LERFFSAIDIALSRIEGGAIENDLATERTAIGFVIAAPASAAAEKKGGQQE